MWAKFFQVVAKYLLVPLIMEFSGKIAQYFKEKKEAKKIQAEATRKLKEHRDAETREERRRTFGGLSVLVFCLLTSGFSGCSSTDLSMKLKTPNCELDAEEVVIEGKRYVDIDNSICFCRDYDFSVAYVGPSGVVTDHPYEYCKQMPGFPEWDKPTAFWDIVRMKINNSTKRFR